MYVHTYVPGKVVWLGSECSHAFQENDMSLYVVVASSIHHDKHLPSIRRVYVRLPAPRHVKILAPYYGWVVVTFLVPFRS